MRKEAQTETHTERKIKKKSEKELNARNAVWGDWKVGCSA